LPEASDVLPSNGRRPKQLNVFARDHIRLTAGEAVSIRNGQRAEIRCVAR
jgi:hypothetical protein